MTTPIFYDVRQNVDSLDSFSPSAGKPARFVELMRHYSFHDYGGDLGGFLVITMDDLYAVHDRAHVDAVFAGEVANGFGNTDPRVPESCLWTIGSLLAAARFALRVPHIPACSPTSGFHHAGHSFSGGYCTFNGLMVVAAKLLKEQPIGLRIGILDCDFHYGDGTADILKHKPDLAGSIMHRSSGEHFHDGDDPDEFFLWLQESIADMNNFGCDFVLYQAGADMHKKDPLGGLLDTNQMEQRDRMVFAGIKGAIAWNLAGGYQQPKSSSLFEDPVLQIHRNTLHASNDSIKSRTP